MLVSLHSKVASWLARFTLAGNLAPVRVQQKRQKLHKLKVQAPSVAHQHPLHDFERPHLNPAMGTHCTLDPKTGLR